MQATIVDAFEKAHQTTDYKRRCLSTIATHDVDPAVLEQLYVRWITTCSVSFRMAKQAEFRALLCFLNPAIDNWLPNSPSTIRSWTLRIYETQKLRVKREIQSALSKVHFTVDLWTSPNALAFLVIVAHYTSESGQLEYSVLALRELDGKHSGPNMADCVMEIINDYGIASKVGYFMMDNADNNGTMMKALSTRTYVIWPAHALYSGGLQTTMHSQPVTHAKWPVNSTFRPVSDCLQCGTPPPALQRPYHKPSRSVLSLSDQR